MCVSRRNKGKKKTGKQSGWGGGEEEGVKKGKRWRERKEGRKRNR